MKYVFLTLVTLGASFASACIDISGKYLDGDTITNFQQSQCQFLVEAWCVKGEKVCNKESFTWIMGKVVGRGDNPVYWPHWGIIEPDIDSLKQTFVKELAYQQPDGSLCRYKVRWFRKEPNGNLRVTTRLLCNKSESKEVDVDNIWDLVQ